MYFPTGPCTEDRLREKHLQSSMYACVHILHLYRQLKSWIATYAFSKYNRASSDHFFHKKSENMVPTLAICIYVSTELRLKVISSLICSII